jgi:hypothetical protein
MRSLPWYYPTTAAPGWVCWSAVIELALRNMIKVVWRQQAKPAEIRAASSLAPTVLFTPTRTDDSDRHRTPVALTIRFRGFERHGSEPELVGSPVRRVWWELSHTDAPWPRTSPPIAARRRRQRHLSAPGADTIWQWAALADKQQPAEALHYLGIEGP